MLHLAALTSAWQSNLKGMLLSDILELELSYTLKTVAVALLCLFEIAVCFIFWTIFIWKSTAFVENETMVWWQSPMINLKLRRQMNKVILSGPAMASHCCTILYPEMRIRNLIAFAQQMSWTQILMMVSTLRPGLQWLREFGNKVSKIIYKRDNLVSRIHGCWDPIRTHYYRVFILLWHNSRMK